MHCSCNLCQTHSAVLLQTFFCSEIKLTRFFAYYILSLVWKLSTLQTFFCSAFVMFVVFFLSWIVHSSRWSQISQKDISFWPQNHSTNEWLLSRRGKEIVFVLIPLVLFRLIVEVCLPTSRGKSVYFFACLSQKSGSINCSLFNK